MNIPDKKQSIWLPIIVGIVILILAAAAIMVLSQNNVKDTTDTGVNNTNVGGVIKVTAPSGAGYFTGLTPNYGWNGSYLSSAGIYETLFTYDDEMNLEPVLAENYTRVSDTEWRIYLRHEVKFHDGTAMNADAVVYSLNRLLNADNSRSSEY